MKKEGGLDILIGNYTTFMVTLDVVGLIIAVFEIIFKHFERFSHPFHRRIWCFKDSYISTFFIKR
jgi:hypothetical protein